MKNLLLAVILTVMTLAASAQIPKGTSTIGGSISLSYQEKKNGVPINTKPPPST